MSGYCIISGLIAALSPETGKFCLELAKAAGKYGTRISFDLNYRESFWKGRAEELRALFTEIASITDILIGNEEDFQLALGSPGPGGRWREHFREDRKLQGHDRQRAACIPEGLGICYNPFARW
ncbi:hypothetical protein [Aminivibrio sp.]|uniref:hypothetical protein n=1 Tax=Aminivibrio sp. TaxID=1872489 RepID=UPI003D98921C